MKITLEDTTRDKHYTCVKVETGTDELTMEECVNRLVKPALVGYGYSAELVEEYFGDGE
jgi:hypothetical protein